MKPALKQPRSKRLKLTYDELISNVAFNFNLRRYIAVAFLFIALAAASLFSLDMFNFAVINTLDGRLEVVKMVELVLPFLGIALGAVALGIIVYVAVWRRSVGRGLHSLTSEHNLRTFGTHRSH
jgi:hypothetical protein